MKKLLTILSLVLIPFCVFSQQSKQKKAPLLAKFDDNVKLPLTTKERAQIIEVYGDSAEKYVFSNPHRLKNIKQILRNRVKIKLITEEKDKKKCSKLSEITINDGYVSGIKRDKVFNPKTFNPLKYNFEFYSTVGSMIKVDNTNYYIIIKSQYH